MPITLGSNILSLKAQRELVKSADQISKNFERLSSGLRINRASDDAAGLSIAMRLNTDARIATQGIRNINDGVSILNIAEGALTALQAIVTRGIELSEQAANGVYTTKQRTAMQKESDALVQEFNRIIQTTTFNGNQILASSSYTFNIQAGSGSGSTLTSSIGTSLARTVGSGAFASFVDIAATNPQNIVTADLNNDGIVDILSPGAANVATYYIGNGDGTFRAPISLTSVNTFSILRAADVNGDGVMDIIGGGGFGGAQVSIFLGNSNGSYSSERTYAGAANSRDLQLADLNNDGKLDLVQVNQVGPSLLVLMGNGDGSFTSATTQTAAASVSGLQVFDVNGDGILDLLDTNAGASDTIGIYIGNGNGTFLARATLLTGDNPVKLEFADLNRDGFMDLVTTDNASTYVSVFMGNGDGTFKPRTSYSVGSIPYGLALGDFTGDGIPDIAEVDSGSDLLRVLINNGDGTFGNPTTYSVQSTGTRLAIGDFNGDGIMDAAVNGPSENTIRLLFGATRQVTTFGYLSLASVNDSRTSLTAWSTELTRISAEKGAVGAHLSRLEVAAQNLQAMAVNYREAASRIMDVDIASESAELLRRTILQKATTAILAQANQQPSISLGLLE